MAGASNERSLLIAILIVVGLALVAATSQVLLLMFAGVLLGLFLRLASLRVSRWTGLSPGWSLAMLLLVALLVLVIAGSIAAPMLVAQVQELSQQLPRSLQALKDQVPWIGSWLSTGAGQLRQLAGQALGHLSTAAGVIGSIIIVVVIGLFTAADPAAYRDRFVAVFPPEHRGRVRGVLSDCARDLGAWMQGKVFAMVLTGLLTAVGLWLLDVPMVLLLATLTALIAFVPNFGPIVAAIPAMLLAGAAEPVRALYVAGLYLVTQGIEGYLITPLVQQNRTSIAPAFILAAQLVMGSLTGVLGVALAVPLLVVGRVLFRAARDHGQRVPGLAAEATAAV